MEFRPFAEAREHVRRLGLKSQSEWRKKYCKSGQRPVDIPANPDNIYKGDWKSWGDFLGTGKIADQLKEYRSFYEARTYVMSLEIKSQREWKEYVNTGKKPEDIPVAPFKTYKKNWTTWGDFLGTGRIADQYREYLPFEQARKFVHQLFLTNQDRWREYCKSNLKPSNIPSNPARTYKREWISMGDWLGTGSIASFNKKFMPFNNAREHIQKLRLKSQTDWKNYSKSGKKPEDIPSNPEDTYRDDWTSWGDFLGTGTINFKDREYQEFQKARSWVHSLKLKSIKEWQKYVKSGKKPSNMSADPSKSYKKDWTSWGDFLGTGSIAPSNRKFRSFEEVRKYAQTLGLKSWAEWMKFSKHNKLPVDIPSNPNKTYKKDWTSWGDFLGTGSIAPSNRSFRPFQEAKEFVQSLGLKGQDEWHTYSKSKKRPIDIPTDPRGVYNNDWEGWPDWLGYEEAFWSVRKVKELLHDLIESKIIYQWDEAVLYSFLLRKGLLRLTNSRHTQFFRNLIEASRTQEGRKSIEEYVNSDSDTPPDLPISSSISAKDPEQEIQKSSSQELAQLVKNTEPLYYGEAKTAEQILSNTNILDSINVDEEAMQFYLHYSIGELWKAAFRNKESTILAVKSAGRNGNKYHDTVVETFLTDYEGTQNIIIPQDYSFPYPPTLMQLCVAYKVKTTPYFGNFSGTGAGKTLSAVLASRIMDSKMTIIVCPIDVVQQWEKSILEIFPNSYVTTGKDAFYSKYSQDRYQYLILNYDKFSQEDSPNLILNLVKQKVDFVILDEVHFVKKRDEDSSLRRRNLDGLMTAVKNKNNQVRVLGLSATPVINNLTEGRSLLEIITAKIYEDVSIKPTIPNAVTLYEKLSTISIRELPQYSIDLHTEHIDVQADKPKTISIKHLKSNPLAIEQFLIDARIPEIIKLIEDQTIIYTEYVTEVIEKLSKAVQKVGYSYALYTGFDRSGLKRFLDKKVQVLIASRPISVGVDGLQHICNRLIINTLPWTNAQYQQLLGRLVRKGQIRDVVHVYVIKASVSGYPYDQLKWNRIQFKRTLADCAVDGRLPEKNLVTPQQAAMEAVKWLERLERGEISSVTRRDLNVELTPVEIEQRIRKYGDFTRLNNQFNNENSTSTNKRMLKDPKEWEEYHRQYREARKGWGIIPYVEIIKRIKQLSRRLQIADFGCGEAEIMKAFGSERVYSFDHVAINDKVTACDMKNTGLPDDAIDVATFSLSLMGRNWHEYIAEAKRCLATNGYLLIAETTKSFRKGGRLFKLRDIIKNQGFEIYTDEERGDFTFIEARSL